MPRRTASLQVVLHDSVWLAWSPRGERMCGRRSIVAPGRCSPCRLTTQRPRRAPLLVHVRRGHPRRPSGTPSARERLRRHSGSTAHVAHVRRARARSAAPVANPDHDRSPPTHAAPDCHEGRSTSRASASADVTRPTVAAGGVRWRRCHGRPLGSRRMRDTCASCKYFLPDTSSNPSAGNCHRYAPRPNETRLTLWPLVGPDEWCGEHVSRPNTSVH